MPDPFRHVRADEPVRIAAAARNAQLDLARAYRDGGLDRTADPPSQVRQGSLVLVKNETGGDLGRNRVVGLGAPIFTPAASLDAFLREPTFRGTVPSQSGRYAVLLEPAPAGRVVRAYAAGVTPVRVNVVSTAHRCADMAAGSTAALVSVAAGGTAQILWSAGGTGEQWAVVRIGTPCATTPMECPVTVTVAGCCGGWIAGDTVTATKGGFSVSGTTDGAGVVTLDIGGGGLGTYGFASAYYGTTKTVAVTACGQAVTITAPVSAGSTTGDPWPNSLTMTDGHGSLTLAKVTVSVGVLSTYWYGCRSVVVTGYAMGAGCTNPAGSSSVSCICQYYLLCDGSGNASLNLQWPARNIGGTVLPTDKCMVVTTCMTIPCPPDVVGAEGFCAGTIKGSAGTGTVVGNGCVPCNLTFAAPTGPFAAGTITITP